ncbi:unnamed protein product [Prunus armeniaca]
MGQISREKLFWVIDSRSYFGPDLLGKWWGPPNQASSKADRAPKADDIRAAPALLSNWAKGPPGKPNTAPAHHLQPGQALGPTSPGKLKGRFCLDFSPRALTSALVLC